MLKAPRYLPTYLPTWPDEHGGSAVGLVSPARLLEQFPFLLFLRHPFSHRKESEQRDELLRNGLQPPTIPMQRT
ncbi:hypothetical protein CH063_00279 [Colletotrichum higginsianum]|uniref:Uncharacterized protein n=1 Tax=Colletotrichum higginsianum (strain IMI 349063) TaxID=759273 RepID=H1VDJ0_COLHI|nr:hypothetical protein CH063_00279 [Colletotrichum higginsianum]